MIIYIGKIKWYRFITKEILWIYIWHSKYSEMGVLHKMGMLRMRIWPLPKSKFDFFLAKSIPLNYIHDGISLLLFKSIHLLRICYVKADSCAVCVDARRYDVICAHLRVVFLVLWHRKWRVSARINAIWSAQMRYLRDTEKRSSHVNVTKSSIYQSINHKSHYKVLIIFSVELTIKKITRKWS